MSIDATYFVGARHISQISSLSVQELLNVYIDKCTKLFWLKYLGNALYQQYLIDKTEQRFVDLLEGDKEFEYKGTSLLYEGANEIIADMTYYYFVRENNETVLSSGTARSKHENSEIVMPANKLSYVYNQMVDRINNMQLFLRVNASDYPEYVCKYKPAKVNNFNL